MLHNRGHCGTHYRSFWFTRTTFTVRSFCGLYTCMVAELSRSILTKLLKCMKTWWSDRNWPSQYWRCIVLGFKSFLQLPFLSCFNARFSPLVCTHLDIKVSYSVARRLVSFMSCTSYLACRCFFKLRMTVAEAVGSMCHLMASDKLEEQIPRIIPAILSLYKKNNEHYVISKVGTVHLISAVVCLFWVCYVNSLCKEREDQLSKLLCVVLLLFLSVITYLNKAFGLKHLADTWGWAVYVFNLTRAYAKSLMHLSTWAAGCWRHNWTVFSSHCISRYALRTSWLGYCRFTWVNQMANRWYRYS